MKEGKTCKICGKTFTRRNYLQKHIENLHSKRYSCPTCFRLLPGPVEHACAVENGRFACYVNGCSLKFASGMSVRLHIRDAHQKVDENEVEVSVNTKKGVRDIIKLLCKKVNLLNNCYEELRFQMETITDILKSTDSDFESEYESSKSKKKRKQPQTTVLISEEINNSLDDLIDYVEDDDEEEIFTSEEKLTEISNTKDDFRNEQITIYPIDENCTPALTNDSEIVLEAVHEANLVYVDTNPVTEQKDLNYETVITEKTANENEFPSITRIGSTIITRIENFTTKTFGTGKNSSSLLPQQLTSPLFLKIQYDDKTAVCEADPKLTFHFDTRPPE